MDLTKGPGIPLVEVCVLVASRTRRWWENNGQFCEEHTSTEHTYVGGMGITNGELPVYTNDEHYEAVDPSFRLAKSEKKHVYNHRAGEFEGKGPGGGEIDGGLVWRVRAMHWICCHCNHLPPMGQLCLESRLVIVKMWYVDWEICLRVYRQ